MSLHVTLATVYYSQEHQIRLNSDSFGGMPSLSLCSNESKWPKPINRKNLVVLNHSHCSLQRSPQTQSAQAAFSNDEWHMEGRCSILMYVDTTALPHAWNHGTAFDCYESSPAIPIQSSPSMLSSSLPNIRDTLAILIHTRLAPLCELYSLLTAPRGVVLDSRLVVLVFQSWGFVQQMGVRSVAVVFTVGV